MAHSTSGVTADGRMGLVGRGAVWAYLILLGSWLILPLTLTIAAVYALLNALKILVTGNELKTGRTIGTAPAMHQLGLVKYSLFMDSWPGALPSKKHAA